MGALPSSLLHEIAGLCDLEALAQTVLLSLRFKQESYNARSVWKNACMCPCMCGGLLPGVPRRLVGGGPSALERGHLFMGKTIKRGRVMYLRAACEGGMLESVKWLVGKVSVGQKDFLTEGCDGTEGALMLMVDNGHESLLRWFVEHFGPEALDVGLRNRMFLTAFDMGHIGIARQLAERIK